MPYAWRYNGRSVMKISAVIVLIAANVAVYLVEKWIGEPFMTLFALWPLQPIEGQSYFHFWQIVTYAFLHDPLNLAHIGFNMLALYMFGTEIERYAGPWRLLACYVAGVITAALAQLLVQSLPGAAFDSTVGASGGVFGLLFAFAMMFPHRKVIPLIPPIPMPAWLFATLYAGAELLFGVTGTLPGIAHFAHLGGIVGSALVVLSWRRARASR
jgi:membrane associated rhomboid family serine protease